MARVDGIIDRLRAERAAGKLTEERLTHLELVWGAYIGEVVRREHRDAHWETKSTFGQEQYWIQFHSSDSNEHFEPFAFVAAALRDKGKRAPLSAVVGLVALDCHLE